MNRRILSNREVIEFFKKQTIIEGISEEELAYLVDVTSQIQFQSGEAICLEGEPSNDLYFIYSGKVELVKKDSEKEVELALGTLTANEFFGDMSFIDDAIRSSTVKAVSPTIVLKIPKESSYSQSSELTNICNKMIRNLSKVNIRRLRETNKTFIQQMDEKFTGLETQQKVGKVVGLSCLLLVFMGSAIYHAITALKQHPIFQFWIAPLIPLLIVLAYINRSKLPLEWFGLSFNGWKKSLREGVWISLGLVALFAVLFGVNAWKTGEFYPVGRQILSTSTGVLFFLTFPLYAFIAQLLDRGIIQGGVRIFLGDKRGYKAIALAVLFQFALYLSVDFAAALFVIVEASFFGYIYNRHQTLLGVFLVGVVEGYLFQLYPLF